MKRIEPGMYQVSVKGGWVYIFRQGGKWFYSPKWFKELMPWERSALRASLYCRAYGYPTIKIAESAAKGNRAL